ncbi:MAG: DUF3073 domain-containing protein [Janthinobacterium lividum]
MGRGRQKAKQTKVARELKYFSPDTDYTALQRELHGPDPYRLTGRSSAPEPVAETEKDDTEEDEDDTSSWSKYSATDDDEWIDKRRA